MGSVIWAFMLEMIKIIFLNWHDFTLIYSHFGTTLKFCSNVRKIFQYNLLFFGVVGHTWKSSGLTLDSAFRIIPSGFQGNRCAALDQTQVDPVLSTHLIRYIISWTLQFILKLWWQTLEHFKQHIYFIQFINVSWNSG